MLTRVQIESIQTPPKTVRLFDGRGLFIEFSPSGGRWWRLKYRFEGRERRMSLGVYPETGIKEARDKCEAARRLLAGGIDPGQQRMVERLTRGIHAENTFEAIAREWFGMVSSNWVKSHSDKIIRRLEREVFPWLGAMPVNDVPAPQLLAVLRRIEARKFNETAHRTLQHCGCVFRYAIATGRAERDPTRDLAGALAPKVSRHFASLSDPTEVGQLLRSIDGYPGEFTTACALRLSPLVFVRPGELRKAEWREIDLAKAEWRIPAARMKMRSAHIVPLARQAIAIFQELKAVTGKRQLVFPGAANHTRPMCENTVNLALRRLGYSNKEMTAHGFRSMASTLLNEQGWNPDAIERQLAHMERNGVRAAYNYAQLLPERRKMMQAWADFLDSLKVALFREEARPEDESGFVTEVEAA
jgi:integrase